MARSRSSSIPPKVRQARSDLARLRKLGLTKAKIAPGKRPGGSVSKTLKKFESVLSGRSKVISAPKETRERYREFPQARGKIAVPVKRGEKVRVIRSGPRKGLISRSTRYPGIAEPIRHIFLPRNLPYEDIPRGKRIHYAMHLGPNIYRFKTFEDLDAFVGSSDRLRAATDTIEIYEGGFDGADDEDDDE